MSNSDKPQEDLFCYLILKAPCGDYHLLLSRGHGSLFIHKFRSDPISLKGYRWVIDTPVDCDWCLQRVMDYFTTFGPYGEIATIHDPLKKAFCWIRGPEHSSIPQDTVRPASYDADPDDNSPPNFTRNNITLSHSTKEISHNLLDGVLLFYDNIHYTGKGPYELTMSAHVRISGYITESNSEFFAYAGSLVYHREKGKQPIITHLL